MKQVNEFPKGWDESRVREVLAYYEGQSAGEAEAEHEATLSEPEHAVMEVPLPLVPVFRQLIAEHDEKRSDR